MKIYFIKGFKRSFVDLYDLFIVWLTSIKNFFLHASFIVTFVIPKCFDKNEGEAYRNTLKYCLRVGYRSFRKLNLLIPFLIYLIFRGILWPLLLLLAFLIALIKVFYVFLWIVAYKSAILSIEIMMYLFIGYHDFWRPRRIMERIGVFMRRFKFIPQRAFLKGCVRMFFFEILLIIRLKFMDDFLDLKLSKEYTYTLRDIIFLYKKIIPFFIIYSYNKRKRIFEREYIYYNFFLLLMFFIIITLTCLTIFIYIYLYFISFFI